jgi:acetyl esterase/lipase
MTPDSTASVNRSVRRIAARDVPVPTTVSKEARAALMVEQQAWPGYPEGGDRDEWVSFVEEADRVLLEMMGARAGELDVVVEERYVDGVRVFDCLPVGVPAVDRRVYLDFHGGALVMGGGECCRLLAGYVAAIVQARVWSVDYRMPPDDPYPAALDDCLTVYRALLDDHDPNEVIVGGGSAGGNLAAALILRARDEGLPLPRAAVLVSPEVDLTESGDSFATNRELDTVPNPMAASLIYAAGENLSHPYLSPLFGDFTKGFPPTFLQTGTRDLLLSSTVLMHRALRAAGIPAELHVFEAMPHGGFTGSTPEEGEMRREMYGFVSRQWGRAM